MSTTAIKELELVTAEDELDEFDILDVAGIRSMKDMDWLIDGILPRESTAMVYADMASFKSFMCYDIALSIAVGFKTWHGIPIRHHGSVVYIAAEGASGYKARQCAWDKHHEMSERDIPNLYLVTHPLLFGDQEREDRFIQRIAPLKPELLVVDTLSRCMAELDENTDGNVPIAFADRLRSRLGCGTLFVHHCGNFDRTRARGDSKVRDACDMVAHLVRPKGQLSATLNCTKMKYGTEFNPLMISLNEYRRPDGIRSLAIASVTHADGKKPRRKTPKGTARLARADVLTYLRDHSPAYITAAQIERERGWKHKNVTRHLLRLEESRDAISNGNGGYCFNARA